MQFPTAEVSSLSRVALPHSPFRDHDPSFDQGTKKKQKIFTSVFFYRRRIATTVLKKLGWCGVKSQTESVRTWILPKCCSLLRGHGESEELTHFPTFAFHCRVRDRVTPRRRWDSMPTSSFLSTQSFHLFPPGKRARQVWKNEKKRAMSIVQTLNFSVPE